MYFERTPEEQANARYMLMVSAQNAYMNGVPPRIWANSVEVKEIVKRYDLQENIIAHIFVFVWNPLK